VTVNCLARGSIRTGQTEALYRDEAWVESLRGRIPLRRPGLPQDLDGAIVFLSSDASAYVTSQLLLVEGGLSVGALAAAPPR
jgi:NAD(P)-dependent dehydrogenase (short-subunit alcohol dehydrogenase family)